MLRIPAITKDTFAAGQAIIILVDPDRHTPPAEKMLQAGFNPIAAEAKLAGALASGEPLAQVAGQLGISYETSRSHLKSIFSKMDIHRHGAYGAARASLSSGRVSTLVPAQGRAA